MTKISLTSFFFICACAIYSQNTTYISDKKFYKSKGAVYVPMGSYKSASGKIISVQGFFLTNEITNKEYREFTDFVAAHPDSSIRYIDLKKIRPLPDDNSKKTRSSFITRVPFSQIRSSLIDTFSMARKYAAGSELYKKYERYFTDKKYDDFPVVGVSWNAARYYCIWKTEQECQKLHEKGMGMINDFRLPVREELEYVQSLSPDYKSETTTEVMKSKSGKKDKAGVYNLFGNVDEWLSDFNNGEKKPVSRGNRGNDSTAANEEMLDPGSSSAEIGFRMVSTYTGGSRGGDL